MDMNIFNLMDYEAIFLWGAGKDFQNKYKKQFFANACVDHDEDKAGTSVCGIPIISVSQLKIWCSSKKTLIVISTSKYYENIVEEINQEKIETDLVDLDTMLSIYGTDRRACSLWGLDVFVADIFERSGISVSDISYIDLGANQPFWGNSTANLYLKGARGILIEPTADCIPELVKMRPGDICLNCGIGSKKGNITLYRFSNSYRNTFSIREKERNIALGNEFIGEESISVRTLDEIILEYKVDTSRTYLNLMVPSADKDIVKEFNYSDYDFPVISIWYSDEDIFQFPICKDYAVLMSMLRRVILVRKDIYKILLG